MANDYTSKGDEELIEIKIDDDIIFVEKKYIIIEPTNVISKEEKPEKVQVEIEGDNDKVVVEKEDDEEDDFSFSIDNLPSDIEDISDDPVEPEEKEEEPVQKSEEPEKDDIETIEIGEKPKEEPEEPEKSDISVDDLDEPETEEIKISVGDLDDEHRASQEDLQGKLQKTLSDLNDIKKDMKNTFTSTETISATITSIKGMIDALRKDQLQMQESMKTDESVTLDPKKNIQEFKTAQETMISMGEKVLKNAADAPPAMLEEVKDRVNISKEWLKRVENLLKDDDISNAIKEEHNKSYPNKSEIDKFTNKVWFDSVKFWTSLIAKLN